MCQYEPANLSGLEWMNHSNPDKSENEVFLTKTLCKVATDDMAGKNRPPIGLSPLSNQLPHFDFSIVSKERQSTLLKSSFCIVVAVAICP